MTVKLRVPAILALLAFVGLERAGADTTISTLDVWNQGRGGVAALGGNGVSAYGQTFVAPADPVIRSFTFYVDEFDSTLPVRFRAYLAPWSTVPADPRPVGPILFTSSVITSDGGADGWQETRVDTGGIVLEPGKTYVFFFGTYGLFETLEHQLKAGYIGVDAPYRQGRYYFDATNATGGTLANALARDWNVIGSAANGSDLAFSASFGPLVENPEANVLAGAGPMATMILNGQQAPVDFGSTMPGSPADRQFTIINAGGGVLTPQSPELPPGFRLLGGFPNSIAGGQSAAFTIRMDAAAEGRFEGLVRIPTNAPDSPFRFPIAGTVDGEAPTIANAKNIVINVDEGNTASASFAGIVATDAVDGAVSVVCSPPDNTAFPPGVTTVTCTATDRAGNRESVSFDVIVLEISAVPGERHVEVVATGADGIATGFPADSVIHSFNQAALNEAGHMVLEATAKGAGGILGSAILSDTGGGFLPIVRTGAPGPAGESFSGFRNLALAADDHVSFQATAGKRQFHVSTLPSSVSVGREAPGTGGARFRQFHRSALGNAGHLFTPFHLEHGTGSPATTHLNDTGIVDGVGQLAAREGGPSPLAGIRFGHFSPRVVANEAGMIAFACNLSPGGGAGVFAGHSDSPELVAERGSLAPGTESRFSAFGAESISPSGTIVFRATLEHGTGIDSTNNSGLWTNRSGSLELVAREGDEAPCLLESAPAVFERFESMAIGGDGSVCFLAYLRGFEVDSSNDASLWRSGPSGDLHLIAREGDRANNTRARYGAITAFVSDGTGGIAFASNLVGQADTNERAFDRGVWIDDGTLPVPRLALRRGDRFEVALGDQRSLVALLLDSRMNPFGGEGGYGKAMNPDGQILLRLVLSGGASAVCLADTASGGAGDRAASVKIPSARSVADAPGTRIGGGGEGRPFSGRNAQSFVAPNGKKPESRAVDRSAPRSGEAFGRTPPADFIRAPGDKPAQTADREDAR